MRIEHLRYLVEVANSGSMSKAARKLYVSQPAISSAITALEQEIGWNVLERTATGVQATTKGKLVIDDAQRILQMISSWNDVVDVPNVERICGDVYIGDYSEVGLSYFQDVVMELNRIYPNLVVHSVPLEINPLKDLNNGRFDMFALAIVPAHHAAIEAYLTHYDWHMEPLYVQNCRLMVPPDSELSAKEKITSDMLIGYDVWAYKDFPYRLLLEDRVRKLHVSFDEPLHMVTSVSNNDAIAIFPPSQDVMLHKFVEKGIIAEREISDVALPMEINMIYSERFAHSDAGQMILETIRRDFGKNL